MITERSLPPTIRLRSEQVAGLFKNVVPGVAAAAASAIVLVSALTSLGAVDQAVGIVWALYINVCAGAHIALRYSYGNHCGYKQNDRPKAVSVFVIVQLIRRNEVPFRSASADIP